MKVYIAGKITGNENYRAEFSDAEKKLRALGHIALNPAVLPEGMKQEDYMRICLAMLDSADAIALLPSWTSSGGAMIELNLAQYIGKQIMFLWLMPECIASGEENVNDSEGDRGGVAEHIEP